MANPGDKDDLAFNEQEFLMDFFQDIVRRNRADTGVGQIQAWAYNNFVSVEGDSAGIMNRLLVAGTSNTLWKLQQHQLAMLVPKISIAKVLKDENGKLKTTRFMFNEYTTVKSIKQSARDRGSDVGLVSFTWDDVGTTPGDSGLSFEATLKLKFQSFDGVFKSRSGGIRFADLLIPPGGVGGANREVDESDFQIKAVVGWSVPEDPKHVVFTDRKQLAAIASTQISLLLTLTSHDLELRDDGSLNLTINYIASMEGRMMTPKMDILYYKAEGGNDADQADYNLRDAYKEQSEAQRKLASGQRSRDRAVSAAGGMETREGRQQNQAHIEDQSGTRLFAPGVQRTGIKTLQKNVDDKGEAVEKARQDIRRLQSANKIRSYRRLLNMMEGISVNKMGGGTQSSEFRRIHFIQLDQEQVSLYKRFREGPALYGTTDRKVIEQNKRDFRRNIKKQIMGGTGGTLEISDAGSGGTTREFRLLIDKIESSNPDQHQAIQDAFVKNRLPKEQAEGDFSTPPDLFLDFFYFGDLVEMALQILKDDPDTLEIESDYKPPGGAIGLMLGSIQMYDFENDKIIEVPLADIPISLKAFESWFLENIIKKSLERFPLLAFLRSICSKLITGVMNRPSKGSPYKSFNTRISLSALLLREEWMGEHNKVWISVNNAKGGVGLEGGRVRAAFIEHDKPPPSFGSLNIEQLRQFYFLYVGGNLNSKLKGVKSDDERIGIFHLFLGSEKGLIKKVNFTRTDVPMWREARILNAKNDKGPNNPSKNLLFSDVYQASITMVGNPIFKPGMLIYINPSAILDTPARKVSQIQASKSSQIGIGGYYLITKVENVIEGGKFETQMQAIFTSDMWANAKTQSGTVIPTDISAARTTARSQPIGLNKEALDAHEVQQRAATETFEATLSESDAPVRVKDTYP